MRKLFVLLLLAFSIKSFAQNDTTKYFASPDYGWNYKRVKARLALISPSDTVQNKVPGSIANISGEIYKKSQYSWDLLASSSDVSKAYKDKFENTNQYLPIKFLSRVTADTTALRGVLIGDSNFDLPERTFTPFLKNVLRYQKSRGVGYVTFGNDSPTAGQNNNTYTGSWTQTTITGGGVGLDGRQIYSNTASSSITVSTNTSISADHGLFNTLKVYYKKGSAGTIGYKINGGSQTNVTLSTGTGLGYFTVNCPTVALNSVQFILVSGEVTLLGALIENSSVYGITLSKAAQSGAKSADFTTLTSAGAWQDMMYDINPDFVVVQLGTNDWGNGVSPVSYKSNMATIAANIKATLPNAAVFYVAPPQAPIYQPTAVAGMKVYRDSLYSQTNTDSIGFLSLYDFYNKYKKSVINYYFADSIHYNKEGAQVNANYLISKIFPNYETPLTYRDTVFANRIKGNTIVSDKGDGTGVYYFDAALTTYMRRSGTAFSVVGATTFDFGGANIVSGGNITLNGQVISDGAMTSKFRDGFTIGEAANNNGARLRLLGSNTRRNWMVGSQYNQDGAFEITPSTTAGGSTFTTPALWIDSTGDAAITRPTRLTQLKIPGTSFGNGMEAATASYFGYGTPYGVIRYGQISGNVSISLGADITGNSSGAFTGDGSEIILRKSGKFINSNAADNAYNTLLSWNSSGDLTVKSIAKSGSSSSQLLAGDGSVVTAGTGISISAGTISATGGGTSNTYTPTFTNTTNVSGSTISNASYMQIGNIVHVTIGCSFTPTANSTNTVITFTLPVTTATGTQVYVGHGTNFGNGSSSLSSAGIVNIASTTTGNFTFYSTSTSSSNANFSFQYKIN